MWRDEAVDGEHAFPMTKSLAIPQKFSHDKLGKVVFGVKW